VHKVAHPEHAARARDDRRTPPRRGPSPGRGSPGRADHPADVHPL